MFPWLILQGVGCILLFAALILWSVLIFMFLVQLFSDGADGHQFFRAIAITLGLVINSGKFLPKFSFLNWRYIFSLIYMNYFIWKINKAQIDSHWNQFNILNIRKEHIDNLTGLLSKFLDAIQLPVLRLCIFLSTKERCSDAGSALKKPRSSPTADFNAS